MNTNENQDISSIKQLLERLKAADTTFHVFGATAHKYEMLPPLTEEELCAFETKHQIVLPTDYRAFLKEVCNGKAGPSYGLASLEEAARYRNLGMPFPLTKASEEYSVKEIDDFGDRDDYPGILEICEHGCGISAYLVVNGPTYGMVWDGREEFYPTGLSFSAWYGNWVTKQLRQILNEPIVEKIKIGMTKKEVVAIAPGEWNERVVGELVLCECPDFRAQLELNDDKHIVGVRRY